MEPDKLKVLVVDDTIVYRKILSEVVESLGDAEVMATAPHGRLALSKLEQGSVDLVLLDVEMPEMGGFEALKEIRRLHPAVEVVMVSGVNLDAAEITMRCLAQGALDFVRKPEGITPEAGRNELRDKLRPLLRHIRTRRNLRLTPSATAPVKAIPPPVPNPQLPHAALPHHGTYAPAPSHFEVVGIGVSTGGPNALLEVVPRLPKDFPLPILMVQHMPPLFTASLADHLAQRSALPVREAREGEPILPGVVLIAPGGRHMVVRRKPGDEGELIVGLNDNPPENSCRPAVDVLFRSLASHYDGHMLATIMTGMGEDGREGVRAMKRRGCYCLSQSEATCVVYGMPMAVDLAGLSDEQVSLDRLAERIDRLARKQRG